MEYALGAYSHPEDQLHIFDKEAIEKKDREYEKWVSPCACLLLA